MASNSSKRKAFTFEVSVTPKKLRSDDRSEPVLVLAPFQPHPKLTLENVKVGSTGRLQLSIFNPTSKAMNIELVNAPSEEDGFVFSDRQMTVQSGNSITLSIVWTPKQSCTARHMIGVRPVGRARNLSEICLTVSALKPQRMRKRLMKEESLAKTEQKMKSRASKPLRERNDHVQSLISHNVETCVTDEENYRRTTFTVTKSKSVTQTVTTGRNQQTNSRCAVSRRLESTETSELCTPLKSFNLETANVETSTPAFINKTYDLSIATRSSSERYSVDSLDSCVGIDSQKNTQMEGNGQIGSFDRTYQNVTPPPLKRFDSLDSIFFENCTNSQKPRRSTRSAERINVDLFHLDSLPDLRRLSRSVHRRGNGQTDVELITPPPLKRSDSLDSVVFENCITSQKLRRITRSAERTNVDSFQLDSLPDLRRYSRPVDRRGNGQTDVELTSSNLDYSRSKIHVRHRSCDRRDQNVASPTLKRLDSLDDEDFESCFRISPLNPQKPRRRSSRSAEPINVDLFNLDSLPDLRRISRPVHDKTDVDSLAPSPSKQARPSTVCDLSSPRKQKSTRSVEQVNLDLFSLAIPPTCAAKRNPKLGSRRRSSSLMNDDDKLWEKIDELSFSDMLAGGDQLDLNVNSKSKFSTVENSESCQTTHAFLDCNENREVFINNDELNDVHDVNSKALLDEETHSDEVYKSCKVVYKKAMKTKTEIVSVYSRAKDEIEILPQNFISNTTSSNIRDRILENESEGCNKMEKFDSNRIKISESKFRAAAFPIGVSPPKRRRTPKKSLAPSQRKREASREQTKESEEVDSNVAAAAAVNQPYCTPVVMTEVDDTNAGPSSAGVGFWNVSPPKRIKIKPPSDSPVVLPPPSRVARRSTVSQRVSQAGRTVKKPIPQRRCDSLSNAEEKPAISSSGLNAGCASVGRPLRKAKTLQETKFQSCSVSRLVPRQLRLGSSTSSISSASSVAVPLPGNHTFATPSTSEWSVFHCHSSELPSLFGHANLIGLAKNPFHEHSVIYLENRVIDGTEKDLLKWVNHILSPPCELQATCLMPSKNELQCVREPVVHHTIQNQYRLFFVRRAARALLLSPDVAQVLRKVTVAIEKNLVTVRADKDLHRDLGLQGIVLRLLMCYHPLWLRVALEAVYNRPLHLQSNSDVVGLVHFIRRNLLSDDYLKKTHEHPSVPHLLLPAFEEAMKKFILEKFVMIVYFLDRAKTLKLIRHDPCLFCTDSPFKDSRAILLEFNKELIKGGDMTKYLGTMGYKLEHKQTYLDEFDFRVKDRNDLRDGVRLAKLVDVLLNERICSKLRTPAISRMQKIHNVSVALTTYRNAGYEIENNVTAKDIVDGHREKTLSLLWQLSGMRWQGALRVIATHLPMIKQRILFIRQRRIAVKIQRRYRAKRLQRICRAEFLRKRAAAITIQRKWRSCKARQQQRKYNLELIKAVKVISERRVATLKMRIDRNNFMRMKSAAIVMQSTWRAYKRSKKVTDTLQMNEERNYFLKLKSTTIFIQRKCRLLKHGHRDRQNFLLLKKAAVRIGERRKALIEMRMQWQKYMQVRNAVMCIQHKWRATILMRNELLQYQQLKKAVALITERRIATNIMRNRRNEFKRMRSAIILVQQKWRGMLLMKKEKSRFENLKKTACMIAERRQAVLLMRTQHEHFVRMKSATIFLQRKLRATLLMRQEKAEYQKLKRAVATISQRRRAIIIMRKQRNEYLKLRNATIFLQRKLRATLLMRQEKAEYQKLKRAVATISQRRRALIIMRKQRDEYLKLRIATIFLQRKLRATLLMRQEKTKYNKLKMAVATVSHRRSALIVMRKQHDKYLKLRIATIFLQRKLRATLLMRQEKAEYQKLKRAVATISQRRRALIIMRKQRDEYFKLRIATIFLQRKLRATLLMRQEKTEYNKLKMAVATVSHRRSALIVMRKQHDKYLKLRIATIFLQRKLRATLLMRQEKAEYQKLKRAVATISQRRRALIIMRKQRDEYLKLRIATIFLQRKLRATLLMRQEKTKYNKLKMAVATVSHRRSALIVMRKQHDKYLKLRIATIFLQRKLRATLLMRQEKAEYQKLKRAVATISQRRRALIIMRKQRDEYFKLRIATIFLQRKLRATLLMRQEKTEYNKLKMAVATVSHRRSALIVMRKQHDKYLKLRIATIFLQRKLRATLLMRQEKAEYQKLKRAVAAISQRRRALIIMRKQRDEYLKLSNATIFLQRKLRATLLMRQEKAEYQKLKRAVAAISQRRRALIIMRKQRDEYLKLSNATIFLQRKLRATLLMRQEKAEYQKLKRAVAAISQRRRALIIMRKQRDEYLKLSNATIFLQRRLRAILLMRQEKAEYQKLKRAVATISQRRRALFIMRKQHDKYHKIRIATLFLQRKLRATLLMRHEKAEFQKLKKAVAVVSEIRSALIIMRKQRDKYLKLRNATIFLQRKLRATLLMRQNKTEYQKLKRAVAAISQRRRTLFIMRKQHDKYHKIRIATLFLQRKLRATLLMRHEKAEFQKLKKAVAVVSEIRSALIIMRKQRDEFLKLRFATIFLQQKLRGTLQMRQEKAQYQKLKKAVVKVQLWWKRKFARITEDEREARWLKKAKMSVDKISVRRIALLKMRLYRKDYLRIRSSVIVIQRRWRKVLALRQEREEARLQNLRKLNRHAYVIQIAMRNWMAKVRDDRLRQEHFAAVKIQKVWRGYRCRKALRLDSRHSFRAMRVPGSGKTLRDMKHGVLQTLCQSTSIHLLIRSLKALDVITTMSPVLAEELVHEGIIPALYNLMDKGLARGVSDQDAAILVITVLGNLFKHSSVEETMWRICLRMKLPYLIFQWAANACRSNNKLFCACITLLWLFAQESKHRSALTEDSKFFMKRISDKLIQHKEPERSVKLKIGRDKKNLSPSIKPDWGYTLRVNYRPRHFEEPVYAWAQLKLLLKQS